TAGRCPTPSSPLRAVPSRPTGCDPWWHIGLAVSPMIHRTPRNVCVWRELVYPMLCQVVAERHRHKGEVARHRVQLRHIIEVEEANRRPRDRWVGQRELHHRCAQHRKWHWAWQLELLLAQLAHQQVQNRSIGEDLRAADLEIASVVSL